MLHIFFFVFFSPPPPPQARLLLSIHCSVLVLVITVLHFKNITYILHAVHTGLGVVLGEVLEALHMLFILV